MYRGRTNRVHAIACAFRRTCGVKRSIVWVCAKLRTLNLFRVSRLCPTVSGRLGSSGKHTAQSGLWLGCQQPVSTEFCTKLVAPRVLTASSSSDYLSGHPRLGHCSCGRQPCHGATTEKLGTRPADREPKFKQANLIGVCSPGYLSQFSAPLTIRLQFTLLQRLSMLNVTC